MKRFLTAITLLGILIVPHFVEAKTVSVKSYTTKKGTYVQSYKKTSPNKVKYDNYSSRGNYNPYTGKAGKVSPFRY